MEIENTQINDVVVIKEKNYSDKRGFFTEFFKKSLHEKILNVDFKQINISVSSKNVIRGLHFQEGDKAQGKLIRVIKGRVFDVVADMRKESKTYMKWVSFDLSESDPVSVYVPPGCAHGFLSLSDDTIFMYACTEEYEPKFESGIRYDDKKLAIKWPLIGEPVISEKDQLLPTL